MELKFKTQYLLIFNALNMANVSQVSEFNSRFLSQHHTSNIYALQSFSTAQLSH